MSFSGQALLRVREVLLSSGDAPEPALRAACHDELSADRRAARLDPLGSATPSRPCHPDLALTITFQLFIDSHDVAGDSVLQVTCRGVTARENLAARYSSLLIAMQKVRDADRERDEHFRGLRSSGAFAVAYSALPQRDAIEANSVVHYVMHVRRALRACRAQLERELGEELPAVAKLVETRRRVGYRLRASVEVVACPPAEPAA